MAKKPAVSCGLRKSRLAGEGCVMIGVDEVGRGAWAGPLLVVAARQIAELPSGLKDSKVLSKKRRELLSYEIQLCCQSGEGWVSAEEVDELGLTAAMRLAVQRALSGASAGIKEEIIIDGHINYCDPRYENARPEIDADANFPIVSAASILAKVARDAYMEKLATEYPDYGFERHVGYGTQRHIDALKKYGVTDIHRKSYEPVRKLLP